MKYVIVSGGTVSGLGKGTAISSLGVVLKRHGYMVTAMKIDPYLVSPHDHGFKYRMSTLARCLRLSMVKYMCWKTAGRLILISVTMKGSLISSSLPNTT